MKKVVLRTIFAGLTMMIVLAGCSRSGTSSQSRSTQGGEKPLRFTLVLPMSANEVWNACAEGFEAACIAIGAQATVVSPSRPNEVNEMNALVETAIAEKVDGVITQAVDPVGQATAFAQLDRAGIPFCLVNSDATDSNRLAFIGTGDQLGIVGGRAIIEALSDKEIHFATGLFSTTAPIAISLHEAYLSELRKNPGGFVEEVVICTAADQLTSVQEWTNAFMTYPNINAGMNIDGFGGLGAARAMEELGYKPGDVVMIAIDDVPETLDRIRDGYLYGTMTQNFYRMGYEPVLWLQDFIKDGKKPAQIVNDSGTMLVTKLNIDSFKQDMRNPEKW
jgi:ABC-type sugar transport system substrate-binding protein